MLSDVQKAQLAAFLENKLYNEGYRYLLEASSIRDKQGNLRPAPDVDRDSWVWLAGAADVNGGVGPANDFIRTYTRKQMEIRTGEVISDESLQNASNKIAESVIARALEIGKLPDIVQIGTEDASKTAQEINKDDPAVWSGNILFLALGQDQPFKDTLLKPDGDTYNLLTAIKSGIEAAGPVTSWGPQIRLMWTTSTENTKGIGGTASLFGSAIAESNAFLKAAYGGAAPLLGLLTTDRIFIGRLEAASRIEGSASGDYQIGGNRDDRLMSSAGNDILDGRGGHDTADYSDASAAIRVTIKTEKGTAPYSAGVTGDSTGIDALFGIETIVGSKHDDLFVFRAWNDTIEKLDGGAGSDRLSGFYLEGPLTFDAASGVLTTTRGRIDFANFEILEGGAGDDVFIVTPQLTSINGRDGTDRVDFSRFDHGIDLSTALPLRNIEQVAGTNFDDVMTATGSIVTMQGLGGNDRLTGRATDDLLDGGFGDDVLFGRGGNDLLIGGYGNDIIYGGEGADTLRGDSGQDMLYGGSGADVFQYAASHPSFPYSPIFGTDTIMDFSASGGDRIVLWNFGAASTGSLFSGGVTTTRGYKVKANNLGLDGDKLVEVFDPFQVKLGNIQVKGDIASIDSGWLLFV